MRHFKLTIYWLFFFFTVKTSVFCVESSQVVISNQNVHIRKTLGLTHEDSYVDIST